MSEFDAATAGGAGRARRRRPLRRRPRDAPALRGDGGAQRRRRGPHPARGRRHRRARPRRVRMGVLRRPRPVRRRGPPAGHQAAEIAAASARVAGAPTELVAGEPATGSWASECEIDPLGVAAVRQGRPDGAARRRRSATTAPTSPRASTRSGTRRSGSCRAKVTASTSTSASAAPGISATAIGDGETQRRTYPAARGQYGTRGWELVDELDLDAHAGADRRGGQGAPVGAAVPGR